MCSKSVDQGVAVYADRQEDHVYFFVDNSTQRYVHVQLRARGRNVANCSEAKQVLVPPAFSGVKLGEVWKEDPSNQEFEYKWTWTMTFDDPHAVHDDSVVYRLPFDTSRAFFCSQGFNGKFSHYGNLRYSVDWNVREGTPVLAARAGLVTRIRDDSNESGPLEEFKDKANLVSITHPDHTVGEYLHLRYRGVVVKLGENVAAGQLLGYSGNTGWSTTPHIHFHVCKSVLYDPATPGQQKFETLPVKYDEDGWVPTRGNWCPCCSSQPPSPPEEYRSNGVVVMVQKRGEAAVELRARNENTAHANLTFEVTGENIDTSRSVPFEDVIPAGTERFLVRIEQVSARSSWKYHFKFSFENRQAHQLECQSNEQVQEIAHIFNEIDSNQNGYIVKNEYWNWLRSSCDVPGLSAAVVDTMWAALDPKNAGKCEFRRFLRAAARKAHIPK